MSEAYFFDLAEEGARYGLLCLMTGISEGYWCAGWMSGLEYSLWKAHSGDAFYSHYYTDRQKTLLRLLAEEAGGWWVWSDKEQEPKFLRMDDWLARFAPKPGDAP